LAEKAASIGVPSAAGMKDAFTSFAVGAGGGLAYALATGIFGNGLLGLLIAPVVAGSIVKGSRGTALATIAGFMLFAGAMGMGSASASTTQETI